MELVITWPNFAKREHRSLNQQIEFMLEHSLSDSANKQQNEQQSNKGSRG